MAEEKDSYPVKISGIIEAAFLVVLAQNANVIAIPIIDLINNELFQQIHFVLLTVPLVNMTAIIANWLTCKIYEKHYDIGMLIEDIVTLGVFYLEVYIINTICEDGISINLKQSLLIIGATYTLVFILFLLWNISAAKNTNSEKKKLNIKIANIQNILMIIMCLVIFILAFLDKVFYAFILYCLFIVSWMYIWLFHGHRNKLMFFFIKRQRRT